MNATLSAWGEHEAALAPPDLFAVPDPPDQADSELMTDAGDPPNCSSQAHVPSGRAMISRGQAYHRLAPTSEVPRSQTWAPTGV